MSVPHAQRRLLPGFLDRLLDDDPRSATERPWHEGQAIRELDRSVLRDLENLLNARRSLQDVPDGLGQLADSLLNYGLPDLQSMQIREDHDVGRLCEMIRECIERFEPRLRNVHVSATDEDQPADRRLRFLIEATLVVNPIEQEVRIESEIDSGRASFTVRGSS